MPPVILLISLTIMSIMFVSFCALLASNPKLFVRVWRRIAIGDYYIKSPEWEKAMTAPGARWLGYVLVCSGLGGFYLLLKMTHLIK